MTRDDRDAPVKPRKAAEEDPALVPVLARLERLQRAVVAFRERLPASLRGQVELCNLRPGVAVLVVGSPVWKARARVMHAQLQQALAAVGVHGVRLEVRISTTAHVPPPKPVPAPVVTAKGRETIASLQALLGAPEAPLPPPVRPPPAPRPWDDLPSETPAMADAPPDVSPPVPRAGARPSRRFRPRPPWRRGPKA
jgi:hypothetical protein